MSSSSSTISQRAQQLANQFFREYQQMRTPQQLQADLEKWDSARGSIWDMPHEQQAQYADYVTTRMTEQDPEMVLAFARVSLAGMPTDCTIDSTNVCGIGNAARLMLALPEGSEERRAFKAMLDRGAAQWQCVCQ